AALGSIHGPLVAELNLGFDEMQEISELTKAPLVLHGGTGIPDDQIKKTIEYGHAKINVNTELQQVWAAKVRQILEDDAGVYDPRKIIGPGREDIKAVVKERMRVFGSVDKA